MRQHRTPKLAFKSNHHLSDNWEALFSTDKRDVINAPSTDSYLVQEAHEMLATLEASVSCFPLEVSNTRRL